MRNERMIPGWTNTKQGNKVFSLWRQAVWNKRIRGGKYVPITLLDRIKCFFPWYQQIQDLKKDNEALETLVQDKTERLADSDAQVAELSKANTGLIKLAKERGKLLKEHNIGD